MVQRNCGKRQLIPMHCYKSKVALSQENISELRDALWWWRRAKKVCNCEDDCDELLTPQRSVRRREIKSHSRTPLYCRQCSVKLPPKKLVALYGAISPKIYHAEEKSQMTHNNFILFSLKNFFFADFKYFPSPEMASRFLV